MARRKISDSATIRMADDLLSKEMGAELVILNLRDGVYYGLEDVGARIWNLLQAPITLARIRDTLVAEYSVEEKQCDEDMRALLADLEARGLVVVEEPGGQD